MKYFKKNILIYSFILFASCTEKQQIPGSELLATDTSNVDVKTLFTKVEGEKEFKARCITCHSLRYIEMQPAFPRKTWEKIVDKMIKNFGAPISDSSAKVIVDYIVAVKENQ